MVSSAIKRKTGEYTLWINTENVDTAELCSCAVPDPETTR